MNIQQAIANEPSKVVVLCCRGADAAARETQRTVVRVDRSTVLGNPFVVCDLNHKNGRTRVIRAYVDWLRGTPMRNVPAKYRVHIDWRFVRKQTPGGRTDNDSCDWLRDQVAEMVVCLRKQVQHGARLALVCHCAPQRCHGDVLAKALLKEA